MTCGYFRLTLRKAISGGLEGGRLVFSVQKT